MFQGRLLHIIPAKARVTAGDGKGNDGSGGGLPSKQTYKAKKDADRQAAAADGKEEKYDLVSRVSDHSFCLGCHPAM